MEQLSLGELLAQIPGDFMRWSAEEAVNNSTISITGALTNYEGISEQNSPAIEEVGSTVVGLPAAIERELEEAYEDGLTDRDRRLVLSGVTLAVLAIRNWTRLV